MSSKPFGVGLVGVQGERGWASTAHIPALQSMPEDFKIVGIANTSLESAQSAVDATGVGRAFASVEDLVNSPDVDLVTITVKVPHHLKIVNAALDAGKAVYCEWPIGNGLAEARAMVAHARQQGVLAVAGTQARVSPAIRYVADLVSKGYLGRVLSSTIIGTGMFWGDTIDRPNAYVLDVRNGATMLTIPMGHIMAAIADVLGPVDSVLASLSTRRETVRLQETGEMLPMTSPDQVLVAAKLNDGTPLSIHYRGGMSRGTGFLWEINGTDGDIQVTAAGGQTQLLELIVKGATGSDEVIRELSIPDSYQPSAQSFANNVRLMYRRVADDLRTGGSTAPSFADAVQIHQLIEAIDQSAKLGRRIQVEAV